MVSSKTLLFFHLSRSFYISTTASFGAYLNIHLFLATEAILIFFGTFQTNAALLGHCRSYESYLYLFVIRWPLFTLVNCICTYFDHSSSSQDSIGRQYSSQKTQVPSKKNNKNNILL